MSEPRGLSLGLAHELGLNAAMTSSLIIVLLGGELPPWFSLAALMPSLSMALSRRAILVPGIAGTLLGAGALGAAAVSILRDGWDAAVLAGGIAIIGLLLARLLTRRTLEHDQQALLLSLVLVFAASVLNVGVSYIVVFVIYAMSAVWALSTRQLLAGAQEAGLSPRQARARDDVITPLFFAASGALSVGVLAAAGLIFVMFPRIGFGELAFLGRKPSQLPPSVGFGSDPRRLSGSSAVVAKVHGVTADAFNAALYLRGTVYDVITFDAFAQSDPETERSTIDDNRPSLPTLARSAAADVSYEVTLMPVAGSVIFVLGAARSALAQSGGSANPKRGQYVGGRDRHDQLRTQAPLASPLRYTVHGDVAEVGQAIAATKLRPLTTQERARYLALPTTDAALRSLLDTMVAPAGPVADDDTRAGLVRSALLARFAYSLDPGVAGREAPLRAFLLETQRGHCELFAGGYALLLRMLGIPARVVGGFQGGALAADGSVVFQQRHAHAWVEWWHDEKGWIIDDATPAASLPREHLGLFDDFIEEVRSFWYERVTDYALADQQTAISSITRALRGHDLRSTVRLVVVGGLAIGVVAWALGRRRSQRRAARAGDDLARELSDAIERLTGRPALPISTLRELVDAVEDADHRSVLDEALRLYESVRFGGAFVSAERLQATRRSLRRLRPAPARS
jgi:transglutaminase-like putative cysteine protease